MEQDLLLRETSPCPDHFTSENLLNFTTHCDQENGHNYIANTTASTMQDCMEHCSRYGDNGIGCYGIGWNPGDQICWIGNSSSLASPLHALSGNHIGLLTEDETKGYNEACPNDDLSLKTLSGYDDMLKYRTHCNKKVVGFDYCFSKQKDTEIGCPMEHPFFGFYHAESLTECLTICVNERPLCQAVEFHPGFEIGWANCYLKIGPPTAEQNVVPTDGVVHSAIIESMPKPATECPDIAVYRTGFGNFEISCAQYNTADNVTYVHTQSVTACIDACAQSDKNCTSIVYDTTMTGGYNNCALQAYSRITLPSPNGIYATLTTKEADPSSSDPGSNDSGSSRSGSSSSKAWIAGAVIGGAFGLALIGTAIWWWRRRKSAASKDEPRPDAVPAPPYTKLDQNGPPTEMYANMETELPVGGNPTYNHVELPS